MLPKRNETGLCPDLEAKLSTVTVQLEELIVSVGAMGEGGLVGTAGVIGLIQRILNEVRS